ncbi:MAG: hypothetical protein FD180_3940 [Planctomycetota bacterium]|nr:MAG: hypothetical protein FD180_3940 [Planctomycetota bacterium]
MNEKQQIAHLFRRAGFGGTMKELETARREGYAATLERFLAFESVADDVEGDLADVQDGLLDLKNIEDVRTAWCYRMARTARPLQERMTLFWHNHFATGAGKVEQAMLMHQQIALFRRYAAGNFRSLLVEVSKNPAMLIWLDGRVNRKGVPNENYGRELMELFTIGIGNYTEKDVKEVARSFTGWNMRDGGVFFFDEKQHDKGEKTVLGKTGPLDGTDVIDILAAHPATAKRLSEKLFKEFVGPAPDEKTVEALCAEYFRSGYDVRAMLRVLFTSQAFLADGAQWARIKSPAELVIGALRAMPSLIPVKYLPAHLRRMGQDLLAPPTVKGWDGNTAWLSTTTVMNRFNFARDLGPGYNNQPSPALAPGQLVQDFAIDSPEKLVDHMLQRFGPLEVSDEAKAKLVEYVKSPEQPKGPVFPAQPTWDGKVRGVAHLVMALPEFQLA